MWVWGLVLDGGSGLEIFVILGVVETIVLVFRVPCCKGSMWVAYLGIDCFSACTLGGLWGLDAWYGWFVVICYFGLFFDLVGFGNYDVLILKCLFILLVYCWF